MTARIAFGFRRGALAAILTAALLGGCASAGQTHVAGAPSPDGLMRMADKARDRGELPLAAALYRKSFDADPQRAKPLVSLGQVLTEMRVPDQAAEAFSAALVIEPRNVEALRGLGNAHLALHQPEQAIPPLKEALAVSANDFRVLNALGVAFDLTGDRRGAHQYYRTGLKLAPENAPLRSNYALSLALAGDTEEAVETIAPLAQAPMASPQQRQTVALVYGLAGKQREAEQLARMDLDEATVASNMQKIAALRGDGAPAPDNPAIAAAEPAPVQAVLREPLPQPKAEVEPVALNAVAKIQPAAAPERPLAAQPLAPSRPVAGQQQAALAPAPAAPAAPVASPEAKAADAPAKPERDVWLVQLASYYKPEMAEKGWQQLSAAAPELLADRKPVVEEGRLADQTTVWRLRTGPYTAYSEAAGLCEQLKAKGVDCYVAPAGS